MRKACNVVLEDKRCTYPFSKTGTAYSDVLGVSKLSRSRRDARESVCLNCGHFHTQQQVTALLDMVDRTTSPAEADAIKAEMDKIRRAKRREAERELDAEAQKVVDQALRAEVKRASAAMPLPPGFRGGSKKRHHKKKKSHKKRSMRRR